MSSTRSFRRSLRASAPHFVKPLSMRNEDGIQILECHVDGYPKPDVRWEKSGKPIGKTRRIHMLRSGEKCLLQIRMPQADDFGLYTCIATNIVGTASMQVKLAITSQPSVKKLNGSSLQTLSPVKTVGFRSRSMDRSKESIDDSKNECSRGHRSRSVSRSSCQDTTNNSKPKLSNITNGLWKKNVSRNIQKEEVAAPSKKEISKSMEDCRKSRKSFLHKVKIPDIFITQKQESRTSDDKVHKTNTVHLETARNVKSEICSMPVKVNGYVVNETLKSSTLPQVPNAENNGQNSVRERIASYLKRFENSDTPTNLKERELKQRSSSMRLTKNEKNKHPKNIETSESEKFFKLGDFIRRKSSGGGKKSSELSISESGTFVSHIQCDFGNSDKVTFDKVTDNLQNQDDASSKVLKSSSDSLSDCDTSPSYAKIATVTVIPDITGFKLISDLQNKEKELNKECANSLLAADDEEIVANFEPDTNYIDEPLEKFEIVNKDILENTGLSDRLKTESAENIYSSSNDKKIPEIQVEEVQNLDVENSDGTVEVEKENFSKQFEETFQDPLSSNQHCKGEISYSGPLLEECEDLLEAKAPIECLEHGLQRVSSPVESPARILKGPQSVTVLRGESVTLAICFLGNPEPNVLWMKGGRVLRCSDDGRLSILEGKEMSVVTVNEVTADDSGKYVVCVENEGGGDSRFASVAVVGFPEPPGGEPTANEVTDHSLVLSWYGSMYDGGSVVTGYQVEMCTLPDKKWHKVASSVNTSCSVQGLSMGQRYIFRVRAENRYGLSHPSKESKVICLNDFLQYDTSSDEEPEDVPENTVTIENGLLFTERFDLKEEVGKGKFGIVYRCVELSCGRARAAKVIRCLKLKDKEKVRQEIEIMSRLHHPKLMQVLAAFESGRNMIMVMEYISGGELFERVIADDFVLTEHDCILFMKQILDGVAYMHRNGIIHLDLKPENILCKTRTSHKIKIIDFGLARMYQENESLRIMFGTPEFVAPEVISYEPVSPASDMWSVGVICYVLLSGLSPFMGENDTETFANITRGEMDFDDEAFDEISQDAKDFISGLLVKKIKGRMSAEECLKHPWLATARLVQKRPLSTEKLKRFIIRRKWQKSGTAIRALGRMVSLSRSSLGSSCDSYSPLGSPTSSRSRSLTSRSETTESGDSVFSR